MGAIKKNHEQCRWVRVRTGDGRDGGIASIEKPILPANHQRTGLLLLRSCCNITKKNMEGNNDDNTKVYKIIVVYYRAGCWVEVRAGTIFAYTAIY